MRDSADVLILGSGLTGLCAAWALGDLAVVLERESRPGGLVRTERLGDHWFDRVLHLLYFQDPETERKIRGLMGEMLAPCPPVAWCETSAGITPFPFQMNLIGLDPEARVRCLSDFAEVTFGPRPRPPANFEEHLLTTLGRAMCEIFLFPYNRKMWKRPLNTLAPSGFTWNITPPDFQGVLRGAFADSRFKAYNSAGWYPRPPAGANLRGMECVSAALASRVSDLRCDCEVQAVDPMLREVRFRRGGKSHRMRYREALLSTLPLPDLIGRCEGVPPTLRRACSRLRRNRVLSVAISVCGPRPRDRGHWRYYADESLIFTRLVHLDEFDPLNSPDDGWSLLVEITEPAESPPPDRDALLSRIRADLKRAEAMPSDFRITGEEVFTIDPAYVVFDLKSQPVVEAAHRFLAERGVTSLGRYGKWEYSSMASCMRDGFEWGEALAAGSTAFAAAPANLL